MFRYKKTDSAPNSSKLAQKELLKFLIPALNVTLNELIPPKLTRAVEEKDSFYNIGLNIIKAKKQLDLIPPKEFNYLMKIVDIYAGLKRTLRTDYGMLISTNASLKMYELINQMQLIPCDIRNPQNASHIRAFCNAELPGAFIVAINHYVKTMCPNSSFEWVGSSYSPAAALEQDDSTILGDQYGIYAGNRNNWLMGPLPNAMPALKEGEKYTTGNTGDLTDAKVVSSLANAVQIKFGGATIYTSDAGIDVSSDYNRQEELTSCLNFGQILCGLLSLGLGGHLVTKQYTFLSPFSRSLIALLTTMFDELYVVKPLTSRPANSEIYIVGKGFRGIDPTLADALLDRLDKYGKMRDTTPCDWSPLLPKNIMADVDSALLRATQIIHEQQQIAFLNEAANFHTQWYEKLDKLESSLYQNSRHFQKQWLLRNPVRLISPEQQLRTAPPSESRTASGGKRDTIISAVVAIHKHTSEQVRILAKHMKGGQSLDVSVMQNVFPGSAAICVVTDNYKQYASVDKQFHLEHYLARNNAFPATKNYLIINQEFLFDWDIDALISKKVVGLCKTKYAHDLLSANKINSIFTSFTTPDIRNTKLVKDFRLVVHLAGYSWLKGTLEVLQGWFENAGTELDAILFVTCQIADFAPKSAALEYWDSLQPESNATFIGIIGLERKGNVFLTRQVLSTEVITYLANVASIHLCPSLTEGWGHIINNARACGAVVITSDTAPMNELIDDKCGFLVPTEEKFAVNLGAINTAQRPYYPPIIASLKIVPVNKSALMKTVSIALGLSVEERDKLGKNVRIRYENDTTYFTNIMHNLDANIPITPTMKCAWVVLIMLGDSYAPGAFVLAHSLRKLQTKHSIVCMVTRDVSAEIRAQLLIVGYDEVIEVPYIEQKTKVKKQNDKYKSWIDKSFTKWNCLMFTQYDRVILVDADIVFAINSDDLFDLQAPAACYTNPYAIPWKPDGLINCYIKDHNLTHGSFISEKDILNSLKYGSFVGCGAMVLLEPNMKKYDEFCTMLRATDVFGEKYNTISGADEIAIAIFYATTGWTHIHQRYIAIPWKKDWVNTNIHAYHYYGFKPWEKNPAEFPDLTYWWSLSDELTTKHAELKYIKW